MRKLPIPDVKSPLVPLLFAALALAGPARLGAAELDFNRDIRPILSENCFHCHGPDAEARKADLRLDTAEGAYAAIDGVHPIVPGDPEKSELVYRTTTDDADDLMPPRESKRKLTARQKELLRQWIAQGAKYDAHWAFLRPQKDAPPEVSKPGWVRNPIDAFVLKKLEALGLRPSAEADRRTLIRRVSLDLTGLPPSPEEIEAFVNDESADAYEKAVDRLLASLRFGERWARPWLDIARYADSNGYQADQLRDSWAYRDWLIDALNADMPFDRFTIEQLAGDLLPEATPAQKIATGFHRTVTCNVEAGVHPEENRTNQVIDRVNTTGTVWLGATIECAQCHDHKYDPFTMKDYYGLFAYFNNTPLEVENPSGKGVTFDFYGPKMDLPMGPEEAARREAIQVKYDAMEAEREKAAKGMEEERAAWEKALAESLATPPAWEVLEVASFESSGGEDHRILEDQSVLVTGYLPGTTAYTITARTDLAGIRGFKIEALTHDEIPGMGPGRGDEERANFILSEVQVKALAPGAKKATAVVLHSAAADFSQAKWEVEKAIDGDPKTGWAIGPEFRKDHWATFLTAEPVGASDGTTTLTFTLDQNFGRSRTMGRVRVSALVGEPSVLQVPADVVAALKKDGEKRSAKEKKVVDAFYMEANPEIRKLDVRMEQLKKQLAQLAPPSTLVMVEMEEPRETHILMRGEYLNPGEKVAPATPAALPAAKEDLPKNRLGLAQWLVDPENPLVARVTVNRWWAQLFGHGIVATLEDFGTQSEPPTHPELLDWLAVEFVDAGWSMKHMLKLMVMSSTYRQDSRVTPALLEKDPANRFYARGPRFRMSAEMIRDNALAASGLLSEKMHGPPVMPHQPAGLWRQTGRNAPKWVDAKDEDRFRRGVYVVWRRAAPYPSFVNFDGPDRSSCVVERPRTNTPLQALTLMNDPAYVEMALALASRVLMEKPESGFGPRLAHAFEVLLARPATADEVKHLAAVYEERLAHLRENPDKAKEIVGGGDFAFQPPPALPADELAAWFYVANIMLNLDETITKG